MSLMVKNMKKNSKLKIVKISNNRKMKRYEVKSSHVKEKALRIYKGARAKAR